MRIKWGSGKRYYSAYIYLTHSSISITLLINQISIHNMDNPDIDSWLELNFGSDDAESLCIDHLKDRLTALDIKSFEDATSIENLKELLEAEEAKHSNNKRTHQVMIKKIIPKFLKEIKGMKKVKEQYPIAVRAGIQTLQSKEIGKKLVDGIKKVKTTKGSSCRICFELLQNAMDCAYQLNGTPVSVKILLDSIEIEGRKRKFLRFSHNGRAFTIWDLIRVVFQTSMKDRPNPEQFYGENDEETQRKLDAYISNPDQAIFTIGRFGTGFLTTHLLSLTIRIGGVVDLTGVLANDKHTNFKKFEITLDRTNFESIDKMNQAAEQNIQDICQIISFSRRNTFPCPWSTTRSSGATWTAVRQAGSGGRAPPHLRPQRQLPSGTRPPCARAAALKPSPTVGPGRPRGRRTELPCRPGYAILTAHWTRARPAERTGPPGGSALQPTQSRPSWCTAQAAAASPWSSPSTSSRSSA